jgi:quercetin dioxygenase-like cupin family protein
MRIVSPRTASGAAVAARPDRAATAVVYDAPAVRMVVFRLAPGQSVAPHRNPGTVVLMVVEGEGVLSGETEEQAVRTGDVAVYEPNELHGMRAGEAPLHLLATIIHRQAAAAPLATIARAGAEEPR